MPLGPDVRYRRKGKMRLAFKGGKVIEAKNMDTGATHTPEEFAHEREDTTTEAHPVKDSDEYQQLMGKLRGGKKK